MPSSLEQVSTPASSSGSDWLILAGCIGILFLAAVLEVNAGERVVVPAGNVELPDVCMLRRLANVNCPGCGLTRGFIHMMNGNFATSWRVNAAGWLAFLAVCVQIPYRIVQLWRCFRGRPRWDASRLVGIWWLFPITLLGQWIVRTIHG